MKQADSKRKHTVYHYTAVFEGNEDGGYTVTVPEFPGLVTEGKNFDEARSMAEDAISCYMEGLTKDNKNAPEEYDIAQVSLRVSV